MAVQIENLGSLDRKMTLEFARADLAKAREARLAKVGKTMKMAGFRPGKVPKNLVEKQHGMQIDFELQFDKAAEMFYELAQKEGVALAGQPRLEPKSEPEAEKVVFDAFFEVLPEVKIGDFSNAEVTKYTTEIGEAEIDRAGCFAYSPVDGAAANDIPGMLPQEVREERQARFMAVAEEVSIAKLKRRIGSTIQVLVDSAPAGGRKGGVGRSYADAPEIDGVVKLLPPEKLSKVLKVGEFTRAKVVATEGHDLIAMPI